MVAGVVVVYIVLIDEPKRGAENEALPILKYQFLAALRPYSLYVRQFFDELANVIRIVRVVVPRHIVAGQVVKEAFTG